MLTNEFARIADKLLNLPSNMLQHHEAQELPQLVLSFLGSKDCFNFARAAFLVDNRDFDLLKGAAAYLAAHECDTEALWQSHDQYLEKIKSCEFYRQVNQLSEKSLCNADNYQLDDAQARDCAKRLSFGDDCKIITVPMKYKNYGILMYENTDQHPEETSKLLSKVVSFLGL